MYDKRPQAREARRLDESRGVADTRWLCHTLAYSAIALPNRMFEDSNTVRFGCVEAWVSRSRVCGGGWLNSR